MNSLSRLVFHHFGLATRNPAGSAEFLQALGYSVESPVLDLDQNVYLRWCVRPSAPAVELVSPAQPGGPLEKILSATAASVYHVCFESFETSDCVLRALQDISVRVVTVLPPTPAQLFGGRHVSFHVVHGFGLLELLHSPAANKP